MRLDPQTIEDQQGEGDVVLSKIQYEDGDVEVLDLANGRERVRLMESRDAPPATGTRRLRRARRRRRAPDDPARRSRSRSARRRGRDRVPSARRRKEATPPERDPPVRPPWNPNVAETRRDSSGRRSSAPKSFSPLRRARGVPHGDDRVAAVLPAASATTSPAPSRNCRRIRTERRGSRLPGVSHGRATRHLDPVEMGSPRRRHPCGPGARPDRGRTRTPTARRRRVQSRALLHRLAANQQRGSFGRKPTDGRDGVFQRRDSDGEGDLARRRPRPRRPRRRPSEPPKSHHDPGADSSGAKDRARP